MYSPSLLLGSTSIPSLPDMALGWRPLGLLFPRHQRAGAARAAGLAGRQLPPFTGSELDLRGALAGRVHRWAHDAAPQGRPRAGTQLPQLPLAALTALSTHTYTHTHTHTPLSLSHTHTHAHTAHTRRQLTWVNPASVFRHAAPAATPRCAHIHTHTHTHTHARTYTHTHTHSHSTHTATVDLGERG